jgi:hypothetical protein
LLRLTSGATNGVDRVPDERGQGQPPNGLTDSARTTVGLQQLA